MHTNVSHQLFSIGLYHMITMFTIIFEASLKCLGLWEYGHFTFGTDKPYVKSKCMLEYQATYFFNLSRMYNLLTYLIGQMLMFGLI